MNNYKFGKRIWMACFIAIFSALVFGVVFTTKGFAYTGSEGTNPGSGGINVSSCGGNISLYTGYGAAWRWYAWPEGATSVEIKGNGKNYAKSGTITGCQDVGGYYRYAMVTCQNVTYGGTFFEKNSQVGLIGIGSSNLNYQSELFYNGGAMKYINWWASWNTVRDLYEEARAKDYEDNGVYDTFKEGWHSTSALSWFCYEDPNNNIEEKPEVDFLAASQISNRSELFSGGTANDWKKTGIVDEHVTTNTNEIYISKGESVNLTFSHNVYATQPNTGINWQVEREVVGRAKNFYSTTSYSVVPSTLTSYSSGETRQFSSGEATSAAEQNNDAYYTGLSQPYSDGEYKYIMRDFYRVTFSAAGEYTFCESAYAGALGVTPEKLTTVCTTVVVRDPTPDDETCHGRRLISMSGYNNGESSVISRVKNNNLSSSSSYYGWQEQFNGDSETWAKAGDEISWQNCYYPGAQQYARYDVVEMRGNGDTNGVVGSHGRHNVCGNTRNTYVDFSSKTWWNNQFTVGTNSPLKLNNNSGITVLKKNLADGVTTIQQINNELVVRYDENSANGDDDDDTGKYYKDYISMTGSPKKASVSTESHSWRKCCGTGCCCGWWGCPCCCTRTYRHNNDYTIGHYTIGPEDSTSTVYIPYNFKNTADLKVGENLVYAGEKITVSNTTVQVGERENKKVGTEYATKVDKAQVKLVAYVAGEDESEKSDRTTKSDDLCRFINDNKDQCVANANEKTDITLKLDNTYGNVGENRITDFNGEYNVFDTKAGNYMCFAVAVYPASSVKDEALRTWNDRLNRWEEIDWKSLGAEWYVSSPECAIVAKRPSFNIEGGSLYTVGEVKTSKSAKQQLLGVDRRSYQAMNGQRTEFGSWVEQSVLALKTVNGLASGAALAGLYGSAQGYCAYQVPLSFANYAGSGTLVDFRRNMCPNGAVTGNAGVATSTANRRALVDYWATDSSATGVNIGLTDNSGDISLGNMSIPARTTRIVRAGRDVVIGGNISYAGGTLTSVGDIPKMVIYAGRDIKIACDVDVVDAILIAEGNVNTCYDAPTNSNDRKRAKQLTIRGMVIADTMDLGRTFGAATGEHSGTPAEIINYDTSAILWGRYMSGAAESDTLTVTYQHELAPRY